MSNKHCELCGVELTVAKAVSIFGVEEVGRFEHDTTEHTSARCAKLLAEKLRAAEEMGATWKRRAEELEEVGPKLFDSYCKHGVHTDGTRLLAAALGMKEGRHTADSVARAALAKLALAMAVVNVAQRVYVSGSPPDQDACEDLGPALRAFASLSTTEPSGEGEVMIELTDEEIEIARKAVEDVLIEFRDSRISVLRNNGLVCRERDGKPSTMIRLGIDDALRIAMKAINAARSDAEAKGNGGEP